MQIIYHIADDKVREFKEDFLKAHPIPVGPNRKPLMTALEWIKFWGKQQFLNAYKDGKRISVEEQMQIEKGIIT